ncbi:MAG: hypothetical protein NZ700_14890 [Gemmataceae bacterium]|nr:hypothetical protein [Gemmataceae bacterium]MDW8265699.1 hypothetical protein [Gemmataceae bacterium]
MPPACERIATPRGHAKKETAAEQGLGCRHGGFTSKIVLPAADEDTAIDVDVVPSAMHEASQRERILEATATGVPDMEEVVGDKGLNGDRVRQTCRYYGAKPVILFKKWNRTIVGGLNKKALWRAQSNRAPVRQAERVPPPCEALRKTEADISGDDPAYPQIPPPEATVIVNRA